MSIRIIKEETGENEKNRLSRDNGSIRFDTYDGQFICGTDESEKDDENALARGNPEDGHAKTLGRA
jgi:hypothetical protein